MIKININWKRHNMSLIDTNCWKFGGIVAIGVPFSNSSIFPGTFWIINVVLSQAKPRKFSVCVPKHIILIQSSL